MLKIERFIKEYGSFKKKEIMENPFPYPTNEEKKEACKKVDSIIRHRENGLITVEEVLKLIMEI